VTFSAETDSELIFGLSADLRGRSSNRYVGGMMFLLSSASLYTVISLPLQGLGESDDDVLGKTALRILTVGKIEFCEHHVCLLIPVLCFKYVYGH
jgi:hypothetical protein